MSRAMEQAPFPSLFPQIQEIRIMRNLSAPLSLLFATLLSACGGGSSPQALPPSTFAVIGDVPYGTSPTDDSQTVANPAFISAINADADASLVLHVGDIHSGKQYCTQAYDIAVFNQWKAFKSPLIYTPGDNEWADCHKAKEGGGTYNAATGRIVYNVDGNGNLIDYAAGDPVANLELIRSIYFANPGKSLGNAAIGVHTQAQEYDSAFPLDRNYVENVWFEKSNVLFVTVNVPGGSNNDTDPWYGAPAMSPLQAQEVANRSAANLRWLDAAFKQAGSNGDIAVVISLQADMWDLDGATPAHITQYKPFIDKIAALSKNFGKSVLLLNGDSHTWRSDNPLVPGAPCVIEPASGGVATACSNDAYASQPGGYNVPNFHRIVVHGSTMPLEWLKVSVNPAANLAGGAEALGPFSWKRIQPK
jgi:hypothetical protein